MGPRAGWSPEPREVDRAPLERYLRAWEGGDLETIIALLHEDVTLSMPPSPTGFAGREQVARFYTRRVMEQIRGHIQAVPLEANGGMAGFYRLEHGAEAAFFGLQLLEAKDGRIQTIDHFMSASSHAAFFAAGLAEKLTVPH